MFVETVELKHDAAELVGIRVRMGDKRVIDFKNKVVEKGYCVIINDNGKLRIFLTDNPRAKVYAREWLKSLEFKLLLEGANCHVVYGGSWFMQAYSMYRMLGAPMAIKWLVSINQMETTISTYSLDLDTLPKFEDIKHYGETFGIAVNMFDSTPLMSFLKQCLEGYRLEDFIKNYKDQG